MAPRESPDLAIVSSELFDAVQREMERRAGAYLREEGARFAGTLPGSGHRVAHRHVLSGFLECGNCGGAFHAARVSGRYGCAWHRKRGPAVCESELTVPRVALEERIFGSIRERILVPEVVTYAALRAREHLVDHLEAAEPAEDHSARLAEISAELVTLRRIAARSSRAGDCRRLIHELEQERAALLTPHTSSLAGIDPGLLRSVINTRVLEMHNAFDGSEEDPREAFRALLAGRRMRVLADPERQFRVEGVFELDLGEGVPGPRI